MRPWRNDGSSRPPPPLLLPSRATSPCAFKNIGDFRYQMPRARQRALPPSLPISSCFFSATLPPSLLSTRSSASGEAIQSEAEAEDKSRGFHFVPPSPPPFFRSPIYTPWPMIGGILSPLFTPPPSPSSLPAVLTIVLHEREREREREIEGISRYESSE